MTQRHVLVESRMLGDGHVRFGGRPGETDQPKGWHRAPVRPNSSGQYYWLEAQTGAPITSALSDLLAGSAGT